MVVGQVSDQVDVLVVGGGPAGYTAAIRAAQLGRSVTLVDRDGAAGLGGACLHVGCIPSKALIELASAYESSDRMAVAGLDVVRQGVDMSRFQAWKEGVVDQLASGIDKRLRGLGVNVVAGTARFVNTRRVVVEAADGPPSFVEYRDALLATGSRPATLPDLPADHDRVLDSTSTLELSALPATVAVVGAGYIGIELGMALAKLGTKVTIVEVFDRILPGIPATLTAPVLRTLQRRGVDVHLSATVKGLDEALVVDVGDAERRIPAEKVVVAVGRTANTDDMGLERAGVRLDSRGLVAVDGALRASSTIAAVGDITPGPALAHRAVAQASVVAEVYGGRAATYDPLAMPAVVFSDPEIATVGLSVEEAKAEGMRVRSARYPLGASGRAATLSAQDGFVQVVVDEDQDAVVGVHAVGPHASEYISEGALAIEMMASPEDLALTIHPHPTVAEGLRDAAELVVAAAAASPGASRS